MTKGGMLLLGAAAFGFIAVAGNTNINAAVNTNISHRFDPVLKPFTDDKLQLLKVPPGFKVNVFARGQGNARMMLLLPDGTILLTRFDVGQLVAMRDNDGDGVADETPVIANIPLVHGMAFRSNTIYLASETKLFTMAWNPNGTFGSPQEFAQMPPGGLHLKRTIGFDDAGWLYVSIGSDCNNCFQANPELATLVRMKPDGSERTIFARGLRNMIGFDWHPVTRQLWGWDNGSDDRGDNLPPEELNLVEEGNHYGWPNCYGKRVTDKIALQDDLLDPLDCKGTTAPVRFYRAHSAPIEFRFYTGTNFPASYVNDGFVCFRGSWNRKKADGYKIVRVHFSKSGRPLGCHDFMTGLLFEHGQSQFGRPAGLVVAQDGALLISEDNNGIIYRVTYVGRRRK